MERLAFPLSVSGRAVGAGPAAGSLGIRCRCAVPGAGLPIVGVMV
jgi:hypothetical protein